jgi:site-specific DNA-methyltransferase (adenine-specific)
MTEYKTDTLDLRLMDCMELMREYPDKHFDLAIVDPPYGIKAHKEQGLGDSKTGRNMRKESKWKGGAWDNKPPSVNYFVELRRISKNQIVFGGNYFPLPPSRCWLVWDKVQRCDNADAELAWTSFKTSVRIFTYPAQNLMGFMNPNRFHPTEKPVALYRWLLANYAKEGMKILDTHLGSMSHAIAAHYSGVHLTGCELDPDYFAAGIARVKAETAQMDMFTDVPKEKQTETMKLL